MPVYGKKKMVTYGGLVKKALKKGKGKKAVKVAKKADKKGY